MSTPAFSSSRHSSFIYSNIHAPRIVTQKQYDEMKKADFEEKMTWSYSVERLILYTINYFFEQYENGKKTPFNKYFTDTKKQPITNPRIKANYWESGCNGYYQYPDGTTSKDEKMDSFNDRAAILKQTNDNAFTIGGETSIEQILEAIRERKRIEENDISNRYSTLTTGSGQPQSRSG